MYDCDLILRHRKLNGLHLRAVQMRRGYLVRAALGCRHATAERNVEDGVLAVLGGLHQRQNTECH